MQPSERSPVTQLFLSASPLALVGGILFYALGAGIADFLGYSIDWTRYWLGQAGVTLLQLSSYYLKAYYDQAERPNALNNPSGSKSGPGGEQPALLQREAFLLAAITSLTVFTALTVLLVSDGAGTPALLVILGVAFLLAFFYTVPPLRLAYAGYGELSQAIFLTNLAPALAYLLQTGGLHRLLAMITFPMTALCLAMHLALLLPTYAQDLRLQRMTLMVRLGWQRGMVTHNLLILTAYLLVGAAALAGLPWALTLPLLFTMPLGLFQVWSMVQIANGAAPRWRLLTFGAVAIVGMAAYLVTLSLWTR